MFSFISVIVPLLLIYFLTLFIVVRTPLQTSKKDQNCAGFHFCVCVCVSRLLISCVCRFVSQDGNGTQAARRHVLPLFVQHGDKDESTTVMSLIATGVMTGSSLGCSYLHNLGSYGGGVGIWLDAGSSAPWRFLGCSKFQVKCSH